jgi:hypothetical protein
LTALLFVAALPGLARADALDTRLYAHATKIADDLRARGYQSVGVLKFEVQRGGPTGPISMSAGDLNSQMATRMENALILTTDKAPLDVVRAASEVAAKRDAKAGYHSEAARKALLAEKYPLAWGNKQVDVDGFVTGRVVLSPDYKTATVILRAFGKDNLKMTEIARIEAPIGRSLLVDAGQPFAVSMPAIRQRLLLLGAAAPPPEDVVLEDARQSAKKVDEDSTQKAPENKIAVQSPAVAAAGVKEQLDKVLKVEVLYNGKVVDWKSANRLPTPKENENVAIRLRATERLGVVLRVNGVNTADNDNEPRQVQDYSLWVLEPDVTYTVSAFYTKDNKKIKLTAKKRDDVDLSELGDERRIGKIDIDVFQTPPKGPPAGNSSNPPARDMRQAASETDLPGLRGQLRTLSTRKVVVQPRQLIVGGEVSAADVKTTTFNGVHTIHLPVTYYDLHTESPTFLQPEAE